LRGVRQPILDGEAFRSGGERNAVARLILTGLIT